MPFTTPEALGYKGLILLLGSVLLCWLLSGWLLHADPERGTFGDMFGAVNALFSGMAFASLIYSIFLQRQELQMQRSELRLTRHELEGQKLQLAAQTDVLRLQSFENTFFQLLHLLSETVNGIDFHGPDGQPIEKRDCFSFIYEALRQPYQLHGTASLTEAERVARAYAEVYRVYQGDIGHYFRTLYNAIKFVHHSQVADKKLYTNLIRAQLSRQELLLLFYNCQTPFGQEKFRPLVEQYALLKTLHQEDLLDPAHVSLYAPAAYGDVFSQS